LDAAATRSAPSFAMARHFGALAAMTDTRSQGEARWTPDGVRMHLFQVSPDRLGEGGFGGYVSRLADHSQAIVRVLRGSSSCTGFLVRPKVVVTNQHCIRETPGAPLAADIRVTQSVLWVGTMFRDDDEISPLEMLVRPVREGGIVSVSKDTRRETQDWAADWAVLELDRPMDNMPGLEFVTPEELGELTEPIKIAIAGYSGDLDDGAYLTMDWGCDLTSLRPYASYACAGWKGASGAPVIITEGRHRGKVVAVNAAGRSTALVSGAIVQPIIDYMKRNGLW